MRRVRRAFTLIEVLLAIVLTVGLVGAALGFNQYVQSVKRERWPMPTASWASGGRWNF